MVDDSKEETINRIKALIEGTSPPCPLCGYRGPNRNRIHAFGGVYRKKSQTAYCNGKIKIHAQNPIEYEEIP
jgi:hypothetical protein